MTTFDPSAYGRAIADVYDDTVAEFDTEAAVERLAKLAGEGPVCEFGIGTGRLALPLRERGLEVTGVDGSPDMLAVLRRKPGGATLDVRIGDFADTRLPGAYSLVILACNTIFALPDQEAQVRCFANAAAHLAPWKVRSRGMGARPRVLRRWCAATAAGRR